MKFDFSKMSAEELEARKAQLLKDLETPETRDALSDKDIAGRQEEILAIDAELKARETAEAEARETREKVAAGNDPVTKNFEEGTKVKTLEEIRASREYVEAYATYLKTNDDSECRSLLTNLVSGGTVPVPTMVDDLVRHAWENENILSRTRKTGFTGTVKVAFELSADGASIHVEGTDAPAEEQLTLGVVEIKPENIKKWITISDEMLETTGEGFLNYVFEELAYQIMKKLSGDVIGDVLDAPADSTATAVGVPAISEAPGLTTIPTAAANLSDEAGNVCVVLNRLTEVEFIKAHAAGNFAVDPFAGLPRVYTSALKAYSAASAGDVYAIVGDLSAIQVNFPAGEGLKTKYDDLSLAEKDLVKIVGRVYAGHEITAPGRLVKVKKA